jgi:hypothetical protein
MGTSSSREKLGVRVETGRRKRDYELKVRGERMAAFSASTLDGAVEQIMECFSSYSPFTEGVLMVAIKVAPERVEKCILETTESVLTAPIVASEWKWFQDFVLPSSVWMLRTADNTGFLWEPMLKIAEVLAAPIKEEMDNIKEDLKQNEKSWNVLKRIKEQTFVSRQDDERVGLLRESKILEVMEMKEQEVDPEGVDKLKQWVEGGLAVTTLCATAKEIDPEFQKEVDSVMSPFGKCKAGPTKTIDRCRSKLENDYKVSD